MAYECHDGERCSAADQRECELKCRRLSARWATDKELLRDAERSRDFWRQRCLAHASDLDAARKRIDEQDADILCLKMAINDVLRSSVGQQTLHALHRGQGTKTKDGEAWLTAEAWLALDDRIHANT